MKNTIRGKLMLTIGMVVSTIIIIGLVSIYFIIEKNEEAYIEKDIMYVGDFSKRYIYTEMVLGNKSNNYNVINTVSELFKVHATLKVNNEIISNGSVYNQENIDSLIAQEDISKAVIKYYSKDNKCLATLYMPIYLDSNYYGNLIIQKDYIDIHKNNENILKAIWILMIIMLSILIIMIYLAVKRITSPLESLSIAIRKFGDGEKIEDIEVISKDEIGVLTSEFNIMKNNILRLQNGSKEFFDNATHELKTPLTVIRGYTQLLKEENFNNTEIDNMLKQIENETTKMNSLIKKLLDLSKYDLDINTTIEEVNVKHTIMEILKIFKMNIEEKRYDIKLELEDYKIKCIKEDLEVLISNLINNAIIHSTGRTIEISLNSKGEFIIVNEAKNINDNIKERLLDPFVKGNNRNSSGVGLYLCNRIAEKNNYKLRYNIVENEIKFVVNIS